MDFCVPPLAIFSQLVVAVLGRPAQNLIGIEFLNREDNRRQVPKTSNALQSLWIKIHLAARFSISTHSDGTSSMRTTTVRYVIFLGFCCQATLAAGQFIIGHRGASHDAPENTLAAFRLAWERGADGIEGDFYLSCDGRVVCIHDEDTERTAGVKHVVADTTFDQLRTLEVGAWKDEKWRGEKIPSLEEVLETVPANGKMFIELKTGPEIVDPMAKILAASSVQPKQIIVISFNADTIEACEKQLPHLRTHWLTSYDQDEKNGQWKPPVKKVADTVRRIGADGLGSKAELEVVDGAFIEQYRKMGRDEFHVWVVNDLEIARRYQQLGAWSITTDRPGWLHKKLQGRSRN